jgi:DNA-directed RNA polymerase subunit omega
MAQRANLMNPRMEHLLERVDSKFTLVTLSAMRAREINDYYNQLGEGLGKIVPPQVTSVSRKPLSIAMEEIEAGKIVGIPLPPEEEREAIAAAEAQAVADAAAAALAIVESAGTTSAGA